MSTPTEALAALRAPFQARQGRAHTPETGEITAESLAAVEAFAVSVRVWNPAVLPGLIQTTRYAAGAISNARPALPSEEVQRYAHHRARRVDQFLDRWGNSPDPEGAWFAIGEEAIRQPVAHPAAHRAQLELLLTLAGLSKVNIRVVPAGLPVPGRAGQMALYGLAPDGEGREKGARLGLMETPVGAWYTLRFADVARLHTVFAGILDVALDADQTRSLISEALTA